MYKQEQMSFYDFLNLVFNNNLVHVQYFLLNKVPGNFLGFSTSLNWPGPVFWRTVSVTCAEQMDLWPLFRVSHLADFHL